MPFSQQVLNDLPPEGENFTISEEELKKREDLRYLDVCSIDPPGCTDIDDALHVRSLPNGNYEVGVRMYYQFIYLFFFFLSFFLSFIIRILI